MKSTTVGSEDRTNVKTIAQILIREMGLENVELTFAGEVDGGRGWKGEVKRMLLDINRLKSLGRKVKHKQLTSHNHNS